MPRNLRANGQSRTNLYKVWASMISRCHSPTDRAYEDYGARGIFVCQRWRDSFEAFVADMGEQPEGGEVDRKDNDGPYSPDNCRWTDRRTQCRNKRNTFLVTYRGRTAPLIQLCEELGKSYKAVWARIKVLGWTLEKALEESRDGRSKGYRLARGGGNLPA